MAGLREGLKTLPYWTIRVTVVVCVAVVTPLALPLAVIVTT
jgi:hypothetical protein